MSGVPPCHCDAPNSECPRYYGIPGMMLAPDMYAVCSATGGHTEEESRRFRAAWDGIDLGVINRTPPAPIAHVLPGDCTELGDALPPDRQRLPDGTPCGCGNKLRRCGVYGVCTVSTRRDGVACCERCREYTSTDAELESLIIGLEAGAEIDGPKADQARREHDRRRRLAATSP